MMSVKLAMKEVLGNATNKRTLFLSQILTPPKCLKQKEANTLGSNFVVIFLFKNADFFFPVVFLLHFLLCSVEIVTCVTPQNRNGCACFACSPLTDLPMIWVTKPKHFPGSCGAASDFLSRESRTESSLSVCFTC